MDASTRFEFMAETFRIMTGQMAPGKDAPAAGDSLSYEDRQLMWQNWLHKYGGCMNAAVLAADRVLLEDHS